MADIRNSDTKNGGLGDVRAYIDPHKTNHGRNAALDALKADNAAKDAALQTDQPDVPVDVQKWVKQGRPLLTKTQNGDLYYKDRLGCNVDFPAYWAHHFTGFIK